MKRSLVTFRFSYDFESSTNFDNYLKELGVNFVLRKLAGLATPAITISTDCQESLSNVSFVIDEKVGKLRAFGFFIKSHVVAVG